MNIRVITLGKLRDSNYNALAKEYVKRIGRYSSIEIVELSEHKLSQNPGQSEIRHALDNEATAIMFALEKGKSNAFVVAMCVEGKELSSPELALKLSDLSIHGISEITFIIGSSYGLSQTIKNNSDFCLSVSKMTLPHELMRVFLLEQVYRAFKIINNEPYHK